MNSIKKFLSKNSFIVVFAVAIIIALANFLVYPVLINTSMGYVEVPVAKSTISEGTLVTEDMVGYLSITADNIPQGTLLKKEDIVGKFVKENNSIPSNGYFYVEQVASVRQSFGNVYKELKEGEWAYTLVVPTRYCQNGAFSAAQLIDLYFYAEVKEVANEGNNTFRSYNAPIFGMIAENKRIVGLTTEKSGVCITIACNEDDIAYLRIAEGMGEVFPLVYYGSSGLVEGAKATVYDMSATRKWIDERTHRIFVTDLLERYDLLGLPNEVVIQHIENRDDIDEETYNEIVKALNEMNEKENNEAGENPEQKESETPKQEETQKPSVETTPGNTSPEAKPETPAKTDTPAKTQQETPSEDTTKPKNTSGKETTCTDCEDSKDNKARVG